MNKKIEYWITIGPACLNEEMLQKMQEYGMNGIRLNLNHADLEEYESFFQKLKKNAEDPLRFMIDLQSGSWRLSKLSKPVMAEKGEVLSAHQLHLEDALTALLKPGMLILVDDGKIQLEVLDKNRYQVMVPGLIKKGKSIAIEGVELPRKVLSSSDRKNLLKARQMGVDVVMQPFVEKAADLAVLKKYLAEIDYHPQIYAKAETAKGFENLKDFIEEADMLVIARGDLASGVGLKHIGAVQHQMEQLAHRHHVPYLVVTQLLASMEENPYPTRAEVHDIFTSVYNGAAALMLTNETAAGKYPLEALETLCEIGQEALSFREKRP